MTTTTTAANVITCPACQKKNRVRPTANGTPRCGACRQPLPWLIEATDATLAAELQASVPVLLDLWAPWCGPCRTMAPVLEQLAADRAGHLKIAKVNVDQNPATASRFRAQSIPLLVLTHGGAEVDRRTGALPSHQLRAWLENH
ncbi:thioredoxin [Paractinoplanes rhizophilus]|jgi:thioredoxin 2|uniref:Thioredoxin n=1 Tax=Paractinoplanes rhizophilus TaxID=1416877 RepID=A0ABW2I5N9_9ACTN|nr:thioredoxin [Actinoplanes sp.]